MNNRTTTATRDPLSPAGIRAERRRIIESIRALRRLLRKRGAFEVADRRRLNREATERTRAEEAHAKALRRIEEDRTRREGSLRRDLDGLDGKREQREARALAVLRREFVDRRLRNTPLTVAELNGFGTGLIRDLAAHGIETAADFTKVTWERSPNGGNVLYIHRADGHRVHINGIGQGRSRPLMEWRQAALARAEARAPRTLPPDERHRITEIIEAERTRLHEELAASARATDAARAEAEQRHAETLERVAAAEREAARLADLRRAEFDAMAEQLLALQAELSAHMDRHGDAGRRIRRAQRRALRPVPVAASTATPTAAPTLSAIPSPRTPVDLTKKPAPEDRVSPGWLLPILYFAFTTVVGVGELADNTAPVGLMITSRLVALATTAELCRQWIPRLRRRTPGRMPSGIGWQTSGVFLGLAAAGMFVDEKSDVFGAACVVSVLAVLLFLAGTGLRIRPSDPVRPS
ncbi:hypothetical protein [Streptomyces sp. G1]|uniref:hypothetical protein n=1 Tax=Streptomyces sp. G1 TaxID=361572 RepID=UPI00202EB3D5|nr:hypothetical protein [Streptomyces sp. G1]MCM1972416.1 hypothetical protein [Streptomyces sp. G1]